MAPPLTPSRARNAAATRAAILQAARRRFAREGYDQTGLREVAADAGVAAFAVVDVDVEACEPVVVSSAAGITAPAVGTWTASAAVRQAATRIPDLVLLSLMSPSRPRGAGWIGRLPSFCKQPLMR